MTRSGQTGSGGRPPVEVVRHVLPGAELDIEHAEEDRRDPLAASGEDFARSDVTVPMPQPADVLGLIAAHLTCAQSRLGALGAVGLSCALSAALAQALRPKETLNR